MPFKSLLCKKKHLLLLLICKRNGKLLVGKRDIFHVVLFFSFFSKKVSFFTLLLQLRTKGYTWRTGYEYKWRITFFFRVSFCLSTKRLWELKAHLLTNNQDCWRATCFQNLQQKVKTHCLQLWRSFIKEIDLLSSSRFNFTTFRKMFHARPSITAHKTGLWKCHTPLSLNPMSFPCWV